MWEISLAKSLIANQFQGWDRLAVMISTSNAPATTTATASATATATVTATVIAAAIMASQIKNDLTTALFQISNSRYGTSCRKPISLSRIGLDWICLTTTHVLHRLMCLKSCFHSLKSRPIQVNVSQSCFHSLNNYSSLIILSTSGG